jgi:hypothetical protein
MTVRRVISRKLFRKNRALKYPAQCLIYSSGAPTAPASTRAGVFAWSSATGGVYGVISTGTSAIVGAAALISTGSA